MHVSVWPFSHLHHLHPRDHTGNQRRFGIPEGFSKAARGPVQRDTHAQRDVVGGSSVGGDEVGGSQLTKS